MNKIKRTIALIICLLMVMGNFAFAEEVQLISAPALDYEGHWAEATIQKWMNEGRVTGYPDGSYKPDNNVTRAEFVKLVNSIIDYNKKVTVTYKDVSTKEWFYDYVGVAQAIGYISGYSPDKFGPNDYITREQAASILARIQYLANNAAAAEKFNDSKNISKWAIESVGAAANAGFIAGYEGNFKPLNNLTRAEALTMVNNVLVNSKNVVLYNAGDKLEDTIINGDLIIAKTVGEGNVYLTNVEVRGNIYVYGGGVNSVYFNNVKVAKIVVDKDKVRLVLGEGTNVQEVEITTEVTLENTDGTIAKVTINADNEVTLTGDFKELTIAGNSDIVLKNAKIETLVVEKPVVIKGTGTVTTLNANVDGISYEAAVKVTKTETGTGVTVPPAKVVTPVTGDSGPGPTPSYKISVSAVIDGTTYNPLLTTSNYVGTENISVFIQNEIKEILNTSSSAITTYINALNVKLDKLEINGTKVNTEAGLNKILGNLTGTAIYTGFNNIFSSGDDELSQEDLKAIISAYALADLDKFKTIDVTKTLEYVDGLNDQVFTPAYKFDGTEMLNIELRNKLVDAGKMSINTFFSTYGTSVTIEAKATINSVEKTVSFTINRIN